MLEKTHTPKTSRQLALEYKDFEIPQDFQLEEYIAKLGHYRTTKKYNLITESNDINEILRLKKIDDELKKALYSILCEIELTVKNIFIDTAFSSNVLETKSCYLSEIATNTSLEPREKLKLLLKFYGTIIKFHDDEIEEYSLKNEEVPIWIYINKMTFGDLIEFLKKMDINFKREFSIRLGIKNEDEMCYDANADLFIAFLSMSKDIRNNVMHNNVIIGRKLGNSKFKAHTVKLISEFVEFKTKCDLEIEQNNQLGIYLLIVHMLGRQIVYDLEIIDNFENEICSIFKSEILSSESKFERLIGNASIRDYFIDLQ